MVRFVVFSFVLSFALSGCNMTPEGPTDTGVAPMSDAGPAPMADSGTPTVDSGVPTPTEWRSCGAAGRVPTRFRIRVIDGADGPLGACEGGWDPIAYALPVTGNIYVRGSDIDQMVRAEWAGGEVDFNFICGDNAAYASLAPGSTPAAVRVTVEVSYDGTNFEDVSTRVGTATSPSGGNLFRLPLCSSYL